jgi:predicted DNA-binding transcriptional regulator AlpA
MSHYLKIPELTNLPDTGLLRVNQILRFIPISRSAWWLGVKTGRYPKPFKLSERTTVWRVKDIVALIDGVANHNGEDAQ